MKPLFIPLKGEYYDQFVSGEKTDELRLYGKRWNEITCIEGRPVLLSRGYSAKHRVFGEIVRFKKQHGQTFGSTYKDDIEKVYGSLDIWIACITIKVHGPVLQLSDRAQSKALGGGPNLVSERVTQQGWDHERARSTRPLSASEAGSIGAKRSPWRNQPVGKGRRRDDRP